MSGPNFDPQSIETPLLKVRPDSIIIRSPVMMAGFTPFNSHPHNSQTSAFECLGRMASSAMMQFGNICISVVFAFPRKRLGRVL